MDELSRSVKIWIVVGIIFVLGLISLAICTTSIDKHEYGYKFNRFTGNIEIIGRSGWVIVNPIKYAVHKIDLRPYQLRITANIGVGERILNAKLCRFNPAGLKTFIEWHGRSAGDNVTELKEILKCYAFAADDGVNCPFLIVDAEINPKQGMNLEKSNENETKE